MKNGLRVVVHPANYTPLVLVNLLYDVGSRDEDHNLTGFAHLFEHLMFEGSVNIAEFDKHLQHAGGENNAFTTNDFTNYYDSLPAQNLETALWLESDRMLGLDFSDVKLKIQKNVVVEEFNESYLNQPYGDTWMLIRPLVYQKHPYKWPVIGIEPSHIQDATLEDVRNFFRRFYHPANAILSIGGNVSPEKVFKLTEKWFGDIEAGIPVSRKLPVEPIQTKQRRLVVERKVPFSQIFLIFHMQGRLHESYYATDLLSDILSGGNSSRLYQSLVKERKLFSEVNAFITGSIDPGLFVVSGKLLQETTMKQAEEALWFELEKLLNELVTEYEIQKVKNKAEANQVF
ncbi:MAG TPA: pitrilysin family protein, partial [Bacteroidales bacterium]|nr:pitrilysin family protein [Bacteroidales bacterium]